MKSFNSLSRVMRLLALSLFMLNALALPVFAVGLDTDADGLSDEDEAALGFDSNLPDTDLDGTLDGDEDNDADSLSNALELYTYFTDPLVYDQADMDITDISVDSSTNEIFYTAANLGTLDVDYTLEYGYTGV